MNETEIGILALGGLIVLGVVIYNKWQERKHRQDVEEGFQRSGRTRDVLLNRREPDFSDAAPPSLAPLWDEDGNKDGNEYGDEADSGQAEYDAADFDQEEAAFPAGGDLAESGAESTGAGSQTALPEDGALSSMIDMIVELKRESPIDLAALRRDYADSLAPFGRRLNWSGLNEAKGAWEFLASSAPESGGHYQRLRAGLQLVDREGIANPDKISLFLDFFPKLAEKLEAECEFPDADEAEWSEQARQLDTFCAGLDIVLCLSLAAKRGFTFAGTQIRALAEAENMTLEGECYILRDERGTPLFRFWNADEANPFNAENMKRLQSAGLTFQFDVPCVPRGQQVYLQMLAVIRRFAKVMNGLLIDDQGKPLTDEMLERIRQDYVIRPQNHMAGEGLPAGSFLARRLFS